MTREGTCVVCENTVAVDGVKAGVNAGKVVCILCIDEELTYRAECLDCDWTYDCTDRVTNWYHAKVRVQQEGNTHEGHAKLDGEDHETVWRQVEVADGGD